MQKVNRSKIKTLCTIETSDIDLQQGKPRTSTLIPASRKSTKKKSEINKLILTNHNDVNKSIEKQKNASSPLFKTKKQSFKVGTPITSVNKYMMSTVNGAKGLFGSPNKGHKRSKSKSILNATVSKSKSRVKTEYSTVSDVVYKSIVSKSSKSLKNKPKNPLDQTYNMQTYQIIQQLSAPNNQRHYICRHGQKTYLMKKTKDPQIKKQYENEAIVKKSLQNHISTSKDAKIKWRNIDRLIKLYVQKNWIYAIYQYYGVCLSWNNASHLQVIGRVLKNDGAVLVHIIKQVCKGIYQLSSHGYCHSTLKLQNILMKVHQQKTSLKIESTVKLSNISSCFMLKQKNMLLKLPETIYTPPQIINFKLFDRKCKFDRELIQYIGIYDQPWYVDVWGLGVLVLELIAGQPISIEKEVRRGEADVSFYWRSESDSGNSGKQMQTKFQQITLQDILEAQKSLLVQTEAMIQKVSFNKKLQNLLIRMLSINPLSRPNPKQIIKDLQNFP